MIASVAGTLSGGRLIRTRPYRAPHHSASMVSLVGGGLRVLPGEEVRRIHVAEALSYRLQAPRS